MRIRIASRLSAKLLVTFSVLMTAFFGAGGYFVAWRDVDRAEAIHARVLNRRAASRTEGLKHLIVSTRDRVMLAASDGDIRRAVARLDTREEMETMRAVAATGKKVGKGNTWLDAVDELRGLGTHAKSEHITNILLVKIGGPLDGVVVFESILDGVKPVRSQYGTSPKDVPWVVRGAKEATVSGFLPSEGGRSMYFSSPIRDPDDDKTVVGVLVLELGTTVMMNNVLYEGQQPTPDERVSAFIVDAEGEVVHELLTDGPAVSGCDVERAGSERLMVDPQKVSACWRSKRVTLGETLGAPCLAEYLRTNPSNAEVVVPHGEARWSSCKDTDSPSDAWGFRGRPALVGADLVDAWTNAGVAEAPASPAGFPRMFVVVVEDRAEWRAARLVEELKNTWLVASAALLATCAIMLIVLRRMVTELRSVLVGANAIGRGELATRIPVRSSDEIGQLATGFNEMAKSLSTALDKVKAEHAAADAARAVAEEAQARAQGLAAELEEKNAFIRETFGRYVNDDVVESLLATPKGLALGGESRVVTVLMSDLRGFSTFSEKLSPTDVVSLLNHYLGAMTEIVVEHGGTIDEFIGDAILVIFGAPLAMEDHAARAVRCALAMQLAMSDVNAHNARVGLPHIEMGIGINTGEVVVGNIGSHLRAKYGVVGSNVNIASRIESLTVGGQVLVSGSTFDQLEGNALVLGEREVTPKGATKPIRVYEIGGLDGPAPISLPQDGAALQPLSGPVPVRFGVFDGVTAPAALHEATIRAVSTKQALLHTDVTARAASTVKLRVEIDEGIVRDAYAKVVEQRDDGIVVHFTSLSPDVQAFFTSRVVA